MKKAIKLLSAGEVVAFPTETVYGLGADATNENACKKIYELKSRPSHNPMIIHVDSIDMAKELAEFNDEALKIAKILWPGPISIVLKKSKACPICDVALAGLDTIAIRLPFNQIATDLIKGLGRPIAAPSANISNYISPTKSEHVQEAFGDKVHIIDSPGSIYGLESTIIDMTNPDNPQILRAGFITDNIISKLLEKPVTYKGGDKIIAPGMMKKHYSPHVSLRMDATALEVDEIGLGFGDVDFGGLNLSQNHDLAEAGANLYSMLRELDKEAAKQGKKGIAVAKIPNEGIGIAINDKLQRACS